MVSVLSSMAVRGLLAELAVGRATLEAIGGVDAARRVRAGEIFDVVVLADGPMRALEADGFLLPGSLVPIAVSVIAIAVRTGDAWPDLADAAAVRRAIQAAGRVGYSTGPSGDHLLRLLDQWDLRHALGDRLVQAPPGMPVGRLLADGAIDLAVQQTSELMGVPGITVVGPLPPEVPSRDRVHRRHCRDLPHTGGSPPFHHGPHQTGRDHHQGPARIDRPVILERGGKGLKPINLFERSA